MGHLMYVEGISIHWHGIHHAERYNRNGWGGFFFEKTHSYMNLRHLLVAHIANWYHVHSGAHRTDGLYGALIVKDDLFQDLYYGVEDQPENHTLLLMDW